MRNDTRWLDLLSCLHRTGSDEWKETPTSPWFDFRRIRDDLVVLRELVDATLDEPSNLVRMMRFLRARLMRNLGGIADARLYSVLRDGTKRLIEEYISEVEFDGSNA